MRIEFARTVYALARALGHLWATRGPEVYRAAREGRPEDVSVAPEDQEALRGLLEKLGKSPSFEEVILSPEGRTALNEAVLLTVHPSLPLPTPLVVRREGENGSLVWEHTTGSGRGRFHVRYTPTPEPEVTIQIHVCRPQGVAIALEARFSPRGLTRWSLDHGLEAPARPRHWAFLLGLLEGAGEKPGILRDLFLTLEGERWRFSKATIEGELEAAAAAFRAAAKDAARADWALRELDSLGLGKPSSKGSASLPEAVDRLREALKDAEEVLGMDLLSLRWALDRVA